MSEVKVYKAYKHHLSNAEKENQHIFELVKKSDFDSQSLTIRKLQAEVKKLRERVDKEVRRQIGVCFETTFDDDDEHMKFYFQKLDAEIEAKKAEVV